MQIQYGAQHGRQPLLIFIILIYSPFTSDRTLRNIINGIVAGPDVNVHDFESLGNKIIEGMIGKSAFTYKFPLGICRQ